MNIKALLTSIFSGLPPTLIFIYMKEPYVSSFSPYLGHVLLLILVAGFLGFCFGYMFDRAWEALLGSILSTMVFAVLYPTTMLVPVFLGKTAVVSLSDAFFGFMKSSVVYSFFIYFPVSIFASLIGNSMGGGAYT